MPAVSIGIAASVFGAQAIGAGRTGQLRDVMRAAVTLNYVIGGVLVAFCYGFAREILSLFLTTVACVLSRHIGVDGIWVGYSAAFVAGLGLQYLYYRLFWRNREHRALIPG